MTVFFSTGCANLMAITSVEVDGADHIARFLESHGILQMDPAKVRRVTSGLEDGDVRGWMPFHVSSSPYSVHWSMSHPPDWDDALKDRAVHLSEKLKEFVPSAPLQTAYNQQTGMFEPPMG